MTPTQKKKIYVAPDGYDATKKDDVHKCGEKQPVASATVTNDGKTITVSYTRGSFPLDTLTVKINGTVVSSKKVSGSGSDTISYTPTGDTVKVTVELTDQGGYTANGSTVYTVPTAPPAPETTTPTP